MRRRLLKSWRRRLVVAIACAGSSVAPAAAEAWQPARALPEGLSLGGGPVIAPSGEGLFAWIDGCADGHADVRAFVLGPDGAPGAIRPVAEWGAPGSPPSGHCPVSLAMDVAGTASLAWRDADRLLVSDRPPSGEFGPPVALPLPVGAQPHHPTLEVAHNGAAAIWYVDTATNQLLVSTRPAGGAFSMPVAIDDTYANVHFDATVAALPDGRAVLAWRHFDFSTGSSDGPIMVTVGDGRQGFTPPRDVSHPGAGLRPRAAADDLGRTIVTWLEYTGAGPLATKLAAAWVDSDGTIRPPFDVPHSAASGSHVVEMTGDGRAILGYGTGGGDIKHGTPVISEAPFGGSFEPPLALSDPIAIEKDTLRLAVAPDGAAVATWMRYVSGVNAEAARRSPSGEWSAAHDARAGCSDGDRHGALAINAPGTALAWANSGAVLDDGSDVVARRCAPGTAPFLPPADWVPVPGPSQGPGVVRPAVPRQGASVPRPAVPRAKLGVTSGRPSVSRRGVRIRAACSRACTVRVRVLVGRRLLAVSRPRSLSGRPRAVVAVWRRGGSHRATRAKRVRVELRARDAVGTQTRVSRPFRQIRRPGRR